MALELVQGQVKILNRDVETHGYVSGNGGNVRGHVHSFRAVTVEVDGRIVMLRDKDPIILADGDWLVAVGTRKSNGIHSSVFANRNRQTRTHAPAALMYALGGMSMLLGLMTLIFLIGFPVIGFAVYVLYRARQFTKANAMLDEALSRPMPAAIA